MRKIGPRNTNRGYDGSRIPVLHYLPRTPGGKPDSDTERSQLNCSEVPFGSPYRLLSAPQALCGIRFAPTILVNAFERYEIVMR